MNRRSFMQAILAASVAPAIVRAAHLMPVRVLDSGIVVGVDLGGPSYTAAAVMQLGPAGMVELLSLSMMSLSPEMCENVPTKFSLQANGKDVMTQVLGMGAYSHYYPSLAEPLFLDEKTLSLKTEGAGRQYATLRDTRTGEMFQLDDQGRRSRIPSPS